MKRARDGMFRCEVLGVDITVSGADIGEAERV